MNVTTQKFQSSYALVCKSLARSNHRTTLPQSRIRSTAPSEREPGNVRHNVNHPPAGCLVSGRVIFGGSVWGHFSIQPGTCETVGLAGDFHRPYGTQKFLHSTIQRTTLPQSALRAASSLREGAGKGWCHSSGCSLKSGVGGRFSSPLRNSEVFTFHHSTYYAPSLGVMGFAW